MKHQQRPEIIAGAGRGAMADLEFEARVLAVAAEEVHAIRTALMQLRALELKWREYGCPVAAQRYVELERLLRAWVARRELGEAQSLHQVRNELSGNNVKL